MKNLYLYYDSVAGNFGDVFEFDNDLSMRRTAVRSLAAVPPEIARDVVVLHVASIDSDADSRPVIYPCNPPRSVFYGSCPDVEQMREKLMEEASRYSSFHGGDSDEE